MYLSSVIQSSLVYGLKEKKTPVDYLTKSSANPALIETTYFSVKLGISIGVLDTVTELRTMLSNDAISQFFLANPTKKISVKLGVHETIHSA